MIKLPSGVFLSEETLNKLGLYQKEIDELKSFELRSERAKELFAKRNKIGNAVFDAVKLKLTEMCSGARRCVYCEDSVGDEVEHIHPKDLFPEMCFSWENYVYACGNCNGPKNNKFAIFRTDNGSFHVLNPPKGTKPTEPPSGEDAMINPRVENPLEYCMLDLAGTFKFVGIKTAGTKDARRADYTFNEVLRLSEREFLRKARQNAYGNYKARLHQYCDGKVKGIGQVKLKKMILGIKSEAHPTVWREMQRQHTLGILKKIDVDLNNLFVESPESLSW